MVTITIRLAHGRHDMPPHCLGACAAIIEQRLAKLTALRRARIEVDHLCYVETRTRKGIVRGIFIEVDCRKASLANIGKALLAKGISIPVIGPTGKAWLPPAFNQT